jgi:hypothetical protein
MTKWLDAGSVHRVAVYAAPAPDTEWWSRGSAWLGRCAAGNRPLAPPDGSEVDPATFSALTAEPRRYGWHATLRAPWRLSPNVGLDHLHDAVARLCRVHRAFELPDLQVTQCGNFLALCPTQPPTALHALADDCVKQLQPLAAPLEPHELARRRRKPLTAEEDALLLAWGYPWVLQRFRFHFSLTGGLTDVSDTTVAAMRGAAEAHFSGLPPLRIDRLCVFVEPVTGADFTLLDHLELVP